MSNTLDSIFELTPQQNGGDGNTLNSIFEQNGGNIKEVALNGISQKKMCNSFNMFNSFGSPPEKFGLKGGGKKKKKKIFSTTSSFLMNRKEMDSSIFEQKMTPVAKDEMF